MKFKRPIDYGVVGDTPTVPDPASKPEAAPERTDFECVACPNKAAVMHKGTTYCRPCYDRRAYGGTLVN